MPDWGDVASTQQAMASRKSAGIPHRFV